MELGPPEAESGGILTVDLGAIAANWRGGGGAAPRRAWGARRARTERRMRRRGEG
jgi:hypothetical protein